MANWSARNTRSRSNVAITATDASTITRDRKNDPRQGSNTVEFESGNRYHGKGPVGRMLTSAAQQAAVHRTVPTSFNWTPAKGNSEREAFKDEYRRMQTDAVPNVYPEGVHNPVNYNLIQSPGKAYCIADRDC